MVATQRKKLSEIMKELANTVVRSPFSLSSAGANAALLLAHVAWNRSLGEEASESTCRQVLAEAQRVDPGLWSELRGCDPERLIARLMRLKRQRYPLDDRVIKLCVLRRGKVHVEWYEGSDVRESRRMAHGHLQRGIELVLGGNDEEAIDHLCRTAGMAKEEARGLVMKLRKTLWGGTQ